MADHPQKEQALCWLVAAFGDRAPAVLAETRSAHETAVNLMAGLREFCFANESTFAPGDPYLSASREGMRLVWLHIEALAATSDDELEFFTHAMEANDGRRSDSQPGNDV